MQQHHNSIFAGEISICTIDQVWVDFAEQIKAVQAGRVKILTLEAQIEKEMQENELMADSFERMLVEYESLLKHQTAFQQQLLR